MVLVTPQGSLFIFTSVQLETFASCLGKGDLAGLKEAQGKIERRVVHLDLPVVGAVEHTQGLLLATEQGLLRVNLEGEEEEEQEDWLLAEVFGDDSPVKVIQSRADPLSMFVLDSGGRLHMVCPVTLVSSLYHLLLTFHLPGTPSHVAAARSRGPDSP